MKIEEHPGSITIETPEGKLCLTTSESWELLEWLYTHRGKLFAFAHHLQRFQEAEAEAPEATKAAPARARKRISRDDSRQLAYQQFADDVHEALAEPRWKTCTCETCQFVRSVLKDDEQESNA